MMSYTIPQSRTRENILHFIQYFVDVNGYSPSVREIAKGVGLKSTSTVAEHLEKLREAGRIEGNRRRARALRLTG